MKVTFQYKFWNFTIFCEFPLKNLKILTVHFTEEETNCFLIELFHIKSKKKESKVILWKQARQEVRQHWFIV